MMTYVVADTLKTAEQVAKDNRLGQFNVDWFYAITPHAVVDTWHCGVYYKRVPGHAPFDRRREIRTIEAILMSYDYTCKIDRGVV